MTSLFSHITRFFKSKAGWIALLLFLGLTAWRIGLNFYNTEYRDYTNQIWAASYQIMALWGVLCGLYYARLWGGWKSLVGRANIAFALGLCAQLFGQSTFSYFFYTGVDIPYPSIADIGFFGSIPFYVYGALLLIKVSGSKVSLQSWTNKIQAILIPIAMLTLSYFVFLSGYEFDWTQPIKTFLDFAYPLGQAVYVSLAVLGFTLSRKLLGGIMRGPTLLFLIALVVQYISDYAFLYQSNAGTFVGGGMVDYLYLVSYFLMAVSLIQLAVAFKWIKES